MKKLIVVVTGTPGTGKSSFAKKLAKKIKDSSIIELNDLVGKHRLFSKRDKFGTRIVDLGRLNKVLARKLKGKKGVLIVVGHLAPELKFRCDVAVVTRCGLKELSARLEKRKYPVEKSAENLVSEALDYCGTKMLKSCKNCYEVETDAEKLGLINYIVSLSKGKPAKKPAKRQINKMRDIKVLVTRGNRYGL